MKFKKEKFYSKLSVAMLAVLVGFIWSCSSDDNDGPAPPTNSVTVSFTASNPVVDMNTNSATVTYTNTSTGEVGTFEWSFGEGANPASASVTTTASQDVVYTLTDAEQSITVSLLALDGSTQLGNASTTVAIPAGVVLNGAPPREACTETFEADPVCFCGDPANVDDPNCLQINTTNGDLEAEDIPPGTGGPNIGGFWELWGDRSDCCSVTTAQATYQRTDALGSNTLQVTINAVEADADTNERPWVLQAINEPDDTDIGWAVPENSDAIVLVDVFAERDGMMIAIEPGGSGPNFGNINSVFTAIELNQGWNLIGAVVENQNQDSSEGLRPELHFHYSANAGASLFIDNYRVIATPGEGPPPPSNPVSIFTGYGFDNDELNTRVNPFAPNGGVITGEVQDGRFVFAFDTQGDTSFNPGVDFFRFSADDPRVEEDRIFELIDVVAGEQYTITADITSETPGVTVGLGLAGIDGSGTDIVIDSSDPAAPTQYVGTFTASADGQSNGPQFSVLGVTSGSFTIDNIVLSTSAGQTVDFENADTNGAGDFGNPFSPGPGGIDFDNTGVRDNDVSGGLNTSTRIFNLVYGEGDGSFNPGIVLVTNFGGGDPLFDPISLSPGDEITASILVYAPDTTTPIQVGFEDGDISAFSDGQTAPTANEWVRLEYTFTVPDGSAGGDAARFGIFIQEGGAFDAAQWRFDDINVQGPQ